MSFLSVIDFFFISNDVLFFFYFPANFTVTIPDSWRLLNVTFRGNHTDAVLACNGQTGGELVSFANSSDVLLMASYFQERSTCNYTGVEFPIANNIL